MFWVYIHLARNSPADPHGSQKKHPHMTCIASFGSAGVANSQPIRRTVPLVIFLLYLNTKNNA